MLPYRSSRCPSGAKNHDAAEVLLRTLGILALSMQAQGPAVDPGQSTPSPVDFISLVLQAGWVVQLVIAILLIFSAAAWGVIMYKHVHFRRAAKQTVAFLDVFRKSSRFSEVHAACTALSGSPLVGLFQAGYAELNVQLRAAGESKPGEPAPRPTLKSLEAVDRALLRATTTEVARLEHRVSFLATAASVSPYIGLFGTVWGIMTSFQSIAGSGQSSLGVVAPGIAEALVATAAGLFAAIPAVIFYNALTAQVKAFVGGMEDFSMEFLTIAERNFT